MVHLSFITYQIKGCIFITFEKIVHNRMMFHLGDNDIIIVLRTGGGGTEVAT